MIFCDLLRIKRRDDRKIKGQKNKEQEDKGQGGYLSSPIRGIRVIRGLFISFLFFCPSLIVRERTQRTRKK